MSRPMDRFLDEFIIRELFINFNFLRYPQLTDHEKICNHLCDLLPVGNRILFFYPDRFYIPGLHVAYTKQISQFYFE